VCLLLALTLILTGCDGYDSGSRHALVETVVGACYSELLFLPTTSSGFNSLSALHETRPVGYAELVRGNADFRLLWFGQIVSLFGHWFNLIASAALVAKLTESGFAVGALFVVRMLAPFLVSPFAGVVADRFNRKWILFWSDLVRAITVLGFLTVRDPDMVWLLYTLTAIQTGISGFYFTARTSILPDIVEERAVGTANAISSATWSVMLAVGAATGGLVAGTLGIWTAYLIDAATFLLSASFVAQIRYVDSSIPRHPDRSVRRVLAEHLVGFRVVFGSLGLLLIVLQKSMLMLFFGAAFQVILVAIAKSVFTIGSEGSLSVGVMFALMGLGTGIGPLAARVMTGDRPNRMHLAILLSYFLAATGLLVVSWLASLSWVLIGSFLVGLGNGQLWVFSTQLILQRAPAAARGRVLAAEFGFFSLASAVSAALAGAALDWGVGIGDLLCWMAAFSALPALGWGAWAMGERNNPL
jgi:MFS family permease